VLKADHYKKHVYEYTGVEGARLPGRCQQIFDPGPLFRKGYAYYHLDQKIEFNGEMRNVIDILQELPHGQV